MEKMLVFDAHIVTEAIFKTHPASSLPRNALLPTAGVHTEEEHYYSRQEGILSPFLLSSSLCFLSLTICRSEENDKLPSRAP